MNLGNIVSACSMALLLAAASPMSACTKHWGSAQTNPNVDYYTCTMHPSVHSYGPGKCPICSMDLVPVLKKGVRAANDTAPKAGAALGEFSVPVERQQQIGVTYAVVEKRPLRRTVRTVGKVVPDKTRRWEFVARVEGYVQKLYVTSPGEAVVEGQPLLTIYSPELLTAEREFVNLLDSRDRVATTEGKSGSERMIDASRRRLEQWNVTPGQVAALEKSKKPSEFMTLDAPFTGVVESVPVEQGGKVMVGDRLVGVADLSLLWIWADFYEDDAAVLVKGRKIAIAVSAYPGETFEGEVALIDPFLNEWNRTTRVRIDIPNADLKLHPGMYVDIGLEIDAGEALAIPASAVMPTGLRSLVFVDKGGGKLEPRAVQLGGKFGEIYEVRGGITDGERVVASANFLIDAESKVQGAVKSFEEPVSEGPATAPEGAR